MDPGLDRHEWESRWASLEEELEDSPRDVLPELDELVAADARRSAASRSTTRLCVRARGARSIADFFSAREITRLPATTRT